MLAVGPLYFVRVKRHRSYFFLWDLAQVFSYLWFVIPQFYTHVKVVLELSVTRKRKFHLHVIRDLYHKPILFSSNFFEDLWAPRPVEWSSVCNCTSQLQNHHPHRAYPGHLTGSLVPYSGCTGDGLFWNWLTDVRKDDFSEPNFFLMHR